MNSSSAVKSAPAMRWQRSDGQNAAATAIDADEDSMIQVLPWLDPRPSPSVLPPCAGPGPEYTAAQGYG